MVNLSPLSFYLSPFTSRLKPLSLHRGKNWIKLKFLKPISRPMPLRSLAGGSTTLNANLKFRETGTANLAITARRMMARAIASLSITILTRTPSW